MNNGSFGVLPSKNMGAWPNGQSVYISESETRVRISKIKNINSSFAFIFFITCVYLKLEIELTSFIVIFDFGNLAVRSCAEDFNQRRLISTSALQDKTSYI